MKDYSELKMRAEALIDLNRKNLMGWAAAVEDARIGKTHTEYALSANPADVLALIAEVEGLRAQHGRDSAELRSLSQARDDARKERDQIKAEVERLNEEYDKAWRHDLNDKNNLQVLAAEVVSLSKDAARYRWLRDSSNFGKKSDPMVISGYPDDVSMLVCAQLDIEIDNWIERDCK